MMNYKNLLKQAFGDIMIARKVVMTTAMAMVKKMGLTLSEALKRAWKEAKQDAQDIINNVKNYRLRVNKQVFNVKGLDFDEVVDNCMEIIGLAKGKQFLYNVSKNFYDRIDRIESGFNTRGTITFAQDVFVRPC